MEEGLRHPGDAEEGGVVGGEGVVLGLPGNLGPLPRRVEVGERAVELVGAGRQLGGRGRRINGDAGDVEPRQLDPRLRQEARRLPDLGHETRRVPRRPAGDRQHREALVRAVERLEDVAHLDKAAV